jgi:hypothetical protein
MSGQGVSVRQAAAIKAQNLEQCLRVMQQKRFASARQA